MAKATKISPEIAMQELAAKIHSITKDSANSMIKKYAAVRKNINTSKAGFILKLPTLPVSITYNKQCIEQLINQEGCLGIRIYPAINKAFGLTFVIVAIDDQGENIFAADSSLLNSTATSTASRSIVDEGQTNPPYPAASNGF